MLASGMIPLASPHSLIQESLWPNEWLVLVSCIMLNRTKRTQVEKILPEFMSRWSSPEKYLESSPAEVADLIKSLGFKNRREVTIRSMTKVYVSRSWSDARELPGIGEYGWRSWKMFFQCDVGSDRPSDGALGIYYDWIKKHEQRKEDR